MRLLRNIFHEMEDQWERAQKGDIDWLIGISGKGTGDGRVQQLPTGTGDGGMQPPPNNLSDKQREMLERLFHQDYGRYPQSEHEFQTWLKHNW